MLGSILIVDDSKLTRRSLIRDLPSELASHVVEARDGVEALDAFNRVEPRVLFLDVAMPRMGGLEVLEVLRSRGHDARVVVVTSESESEIGPRARALGAHAVLSKPWKRSEIHRALREAGLMR